MSDKRFLEGLCERTVELAAACLVAGRELTATWMAAQLDTSRGNIPRWQDLTGDVPDERTFRLLAHGHGVEIWLIFWPHGAHIGFHDHGGSAGALVVGHGTLRERYAATPSAPVASRTIPPGHTLEFGSDHVHDVTSPFGPSTSLHIYSPATRAVREFQMEAGEGRLRALELAV